MFSFPGLLASDDILSFLALLSSKNPDEFMASQILKLTRGIACENDQISCKLGYILDPVNSICYKVIQSIKSLNDQPICEDSFAVPISFNNDAAVEGFLSLIQSGNFIFINIKKNRKT